MDIRGFSFTFYSFSSGRSVTACRRPPPLPPATALTSGPASSHPPLDRPSPLRPVGETAGRGRQRRASSVRRTGGNEPGPLAGDATEGCADCGVRGARGRYFGISDQIPRRRTVPGVSAARGPSVSRAVTGEGRDRSTQSWWSGSGQSSQDGQTGWTLKSADEDCETSD